MTTERCSTDVKRGTWGALLRHARDYGVSVKELGCITLPSGATVTVEYLHRLEDGEELFYPMPRDWTPDRRLGFWKLANICSRLRISEPGDWPIDY